MRRKCFSPILVLSLCLIAFQVNSAKAVTHTLQVRATTAQALTNEDVVKMIQAKLTDSVVIAKIKSSVCKFDTSTDALIMLKQVGVSEAILQVMLEGGGPPPAAPAGQPAPSPPAASTPSAYGYYVLEDGQVRIVEPVPVKRVIGLRTSIAGSVAVDGVAGDPNVRLKSSSPTFIIYQQSVDIQRIHFSTLTFVPSMYAYEFNIADTRPEFFPSIYHCNYNDVIAVNLWRPQSDVNLNIEPVEGRPGMFKLTPKAPLKPGRYVSYFSDDIRPDGIIFKTSGDSEHSALYFEVVVSDAVPSHTKRADVGQTKDAPAPSPTAQQVILSKNTLLSRGFGFDDQPRAMCSIKGPDGPCQVEAFVSGELSQDPSAYTCSKLDRASYVGHCVNGALEGVSVVIADGTSKHTREAFVSYFCMGGMAYPALTSWLDENQPKFFGVHEKSRSYGCVVFGRWDNSRTRGSCPRFMDIYGSDIFTESNVQGLRDGTFNLNNYAAKFIEYVQGK